MSYAVSGDDGECLASAFVPACACVCMHAGPELAQAVAVMKLVDCVSVSVLMGAGVDEAACLWALLEFWVHLHMLRYAYLCVYILMCTCMCESVLRGDNEDTWLFDLYVKFCWKKKRFSLLALCYHWDLHWRCLAWVSASAISGA